MKKPTPYQLTLESLEERVFFDANPAAAIVEPTDGGLEEATPDGASMQAESNAAAAAQKEKPAESEIDQDQFTQKDEQSSGDILEDQPVAVGLLSGDGVAGEQNGGVTEGETKEDSQAGAIEDVIPVDPMIGEDFTFNVTFNNTASGTVYGPYIDLIFDGGLDGDEEIGSDGFADDGLSFQGATYLGAEIQYVSQFVDSTGSVTHAYATDDDGAALVIGSLTPGDEFVSLLMPFGSFTVDQTPADIVVTAHMSEKADINDPLEVDVITGAMYGLDALDNPVDDPPIRGLETSKQSFMPEVLAFNTDIRVPGVIPDCQEQHNPDYPDERNIESNHQEIPTGPNFPFEYITTIDIADGQEVGGQTVEGRTGILYTQHVPDNVHYLGISSVVDSIGADIAYTVVSQPVGAAGGELVLQLDSTVTGTAEIDDIVITYEAYIPEQTGNGVPIIDPNTADDAHIINDGEIEFAWTPIDPNDPDVVAIVDAEADADGNFSDAPKVDDISHAKAITIQKSHNITTDTGYPGYTLGIP